MLDTPYKPHAAKIKQSNAPTGPDATSRGMNGDAPGEVSRVSGVSGNKKEKKQPLAFTEWTPFPVELLPRRLAAFVSEKSAAIGCDSSMVALPALATMAAAVGTSRRIQLKPDWTEPSVVWACVVSRSGTTKTSPHHAAKKPLERLDTEAHRAYAKNLDDYETKLQEYKNLPKEERAQKRAPTPPIETRHVVSDITIEQLAVILEANPRGVLTERDELAGLFRSFNQYKGGKGSDAQNWIQLFRAEGMKIDRKTGDKRSIRLDRAASSICGTIQPGTLAATLNAENIDNGLAARFLFSRPPERLKKWTDAATSKATNDNYDRLVRDLASLEGDVDKDGSVIPVDLLLSSDAKPVFIEWYNRHALVQFTAKDEAHAAAFSKLEAYGARFALLFTLADDPYSTEVSRDALERGIALAQWFVNEVSRNYDSMGAGNEDCRILQTCEMISGMGGSATASELRQRTSRFKTSEEARLAMDELADRGQGYWQDQPPTNRGGRRTRRFFLHTYEPRNPETPETPLTGPESRGAKGFCATTVEDSTSFDHGHNQNGQTNGAIVGAGVGRIEPDDDDDKPF